MRTTVPASLFIIKQCGRSDDVFGKGYEYFKLMLPMCCLYYTVNKNDKNESKTGEAKKPKTTGNKQGEKKQTFKEKKFYDSTIIVSGLFSWNSTNVTKMK